MVGVGGSSPLAPTRSDSSGSVLLINDCGSVKLSPPIASVAVWPVHGPNPSGFRWSRKSVPDRFLPGSPMNLALRASIGRENLFQTDFSSPLAPTRQFLCLVLRCLRFDLPRFVLAGYWLASAFLC